MYRSVCHRYLGCNTMYNKTNTLLLGPSPRQQHTVTRVYHQQQMYRGFHTSPRNNVNPIVWMFVRPLARGAAIFTGRALRKWWAGLPVRKRDGIRELLYRHRLLIYFGGSGLLFGSIIFYENKKEEMPVTGKRKFVLFNKQQLGQLAQLEYEGYLEKFDGRFISSDTQLYNSVKTIVWKLINCNQEYRPIREIPWKLYIVSDPNKNAFVLPTGQIFVMTGLLKYFSNVDQLAVVLGHEMAHAVLNHAALQASYNYIIDILSVVLLLMVWALLPTDILSALGHWVQDRLVKILFHLPYSRSLEIEADEVGTVLAAKACFDVRESSAIWAQMALENKLSGDVEQVELLTTHPSHDSRAAHMSKLLPSMLKLRIKCNCAPLQQPDPNRKVENNKLEYKH